MRTILSSQSVVEGVVTIGAALLLTLAGYEMLADVASDVPVVQAAVVARHDA